MPSGTVSRLLAVASPLMGGHLWRKVKIAGEGVSLWPAGTPELFVDAVWLPAERAAVLDWADDPDRFLDDVAAASQVRAVVARGYADRTIFGLLLAAHDLLGLVAATSQRGSSAPAPFGGVAIAEPGRHDQNMDWVYHRHGFTVVEVPQAPA